ncbi:uncharacterized protein LOC117831810 [Notolabrus celidotus]|uniref:uncharacterized protein LOC117831810 n=1 Tax=Notolabrus celidotus TaxID=1203425 RepID=UPI001490703D|nr:uncharacterized protein LOC117831810 [Notolabrus celidotus]
MSKDGTYLLFEGFLQKRKDTMKIRWATYWFRLQNTTLFFYTRENCSASHLRGYYYICTVQSVREVQREDSKRFMFEIIMTNGKRKMLAAETAALRQEWVAHLWQAMHLSSSGSSNRSTHLQVCEHRDRMNSIIPVSSQRDSVIDYLPPRPLSAPVSHIHHDIRSITSPACLPENLEALEEPTYQNLELNQAGGSVDSPQCSRGFSNAERTKEGDYDFLPVRKKVCEINDSTETTEGVYDVPVSFRRVDEHADRTESIYDVPSSLLRKLSDHSSEEQLTDGVNWITSTHTESSQ